VPSHRAGHRPPGPGGQVAGLRPRSSRLAAAIAILIQASLGCAPTPESGGGTAASSADGVLWTIDALHAVGGHDATALGSPRVIETAAGPALEFDGQGDGLFVDVHPLSGASEFTVEVVFRPDAGGEEEQRFLHLQETGSKDRLLFETRLPGDGSWFLDTYVKTGGVGHTLYAKRFRHPLGEWYHAALVVGGGEMRHYVDGVIELSRAIEFSPQGPGRTSIGVRINEVSWFKGAIRAAHFTPRALEPEEFRLGSGSR